MPEEDWLREYKAGNLKRAAELLAPMQATGDTYCLLSLGSMYLHGLHRFETMAEFVHFMNSATPEKQQEFWFSNRPFQTLGVALLEKASSQGSSVASGNLATYFSVPVEGLSEQQRASKCRHYFELLDQQRVSDTGMTDVEAGFESSNHLVQV